jgi:hypothetical protein
MNEQNLEPASAFPIGQNARARRRSPRSGFQRSHIASILHSNREPSNGEADATTLIPQQRSFEAAQQRSGR